MRDYRNNELVAQFYSIYSQPVLTTGLESIEQGAANVYTREVFKEVKKEMEGVAALFFGGRDSFATTVVYKLMKFGKPGREYRVLYDRNLEKLECQCRLWNTHGIPCSHIFFVMKHEQIPELPEKLIMKRWSKDAKAFDEGVNEEEEDSDRAFLLRYGALCSASQWMNFLGAKKLHLFRKAMEGICRLSEELEHECGIEAGSSSELSKKIGDPSVAKTKGAPAARKDGKKKRHCSNCFEAGHTKRNCRRGKVGKSQLCEDDINSEFGSDDRVDGARRQNTDLSQVSNKVSDFV